MVALRGYVVLLAVMFAIAAELTATGWLWDIAGSLALLTAILVVRWRLGHVPADCQDCRTRVG